MAQEDSAEGSGISGSSPKAVEIGQDAITRLNRTGWKDKYEPLQVIDEARIAMFKMPEGKSGIVVGSGGNTEEWKKRDWKTLDINPYTYADFIVNVNYLKHVLPSESHDYLLAEYINFDPRAQQGAGCGRLLRMANYALKIGGTLIIQTAHHENNPDSRLPDRRRYADMFKQHGFKAYVQLDNITFYDGRERLDQNVTYYGVKVKPGFDALRPDL